MIGKGDTKATRAKWRAAHPTSAARRKARAARDALRYELMLRREALRPVPVPA